MKKLVFILVILFIIPIIANANIICNDGTTSPTCADCHQGCCSKHDGCSNNIHSTYNNTYNQNENNDIEYKEKINNKEDNNIDSNTVIDDNTEKKYNYNYEIEEPEIVKTANDFKPKEFSEYNSTSNGNDINNNNENIIMLPALGILALFGYSIYRFKH